MNSITEFTNTAHRKIASLNALAAIARDSDEWQRLNAKSSAMGTATAIITTMLAEKDGTLLSKASTAENIVMSLRELAEDTLESIYADNPHLSTPEAHMSVVQVGGQREGYNLALETLRQEIIAYAR